MVRPLVPCALASITLLSAAPRARAAGPGALVAGYASDFYDHWAGVFKQQNSIVMMALLLGAVSIFIITRGKWRK